MYTRNDSLKENSPSSLGIWWQTLIKESQPISDAFFHFFKNLGWSRILGAAILDLPLFARRLGELSRQAWQVTSHPKSPRTTGSEAVDNANRHEFSYWRFPFFANKWKTKIWQNYFISQEKLKKKSFLIKQKPTGRSELTYSEMKKWKFSNQKNNPERGQWHHFKKEWA